MKPKSVSVKNSGLPIYQIIERLKNTLSDSKNVVLQAAPGAGKSTVVPLELLKSGLFGEQKIVMLEPRRMAARAIASYLSKHIGEKVGATIGYQVKNERRVSPSTRLEIVTEGVLLKRIQSDPELEGVGLIIFDEFHERSINADLSLMLALEAQQVLREDLHLLVMSATLDTNLVSAYLGNAPVILCEGRSFPVTLSYQKINDTRLEVNVSNALLRALQSEGDVLVFLAGISDINRCIAYAEEILIGYDDIELLALHGSLPLEEQEKAIEPSRTGKKKVIFTTNIAETSLTIEGIQYVIDSGLEKRLTFDPSSGMSKLSTVKISKASAEQRKGRAGRLCEGQCIRLWSEEEHRSLKDFQEEEILNVDLSDAVLELASAGHYRFSKINWLTPPPKANFQSTKDLLISLELLASDGRITALGKEASRIGLHPRLAKMLLSSTSQQEKEIAKILSVLLSEKDILKVSDTVDTLQRVHTLIDALCGESANNLGVNKNVLKSVIRDYKALSRKSENIATLTALDNLPDTTAYLLLLAFPDRLAQRRSNTSNRYKLANGRGVALAESDPLRTSKYLVVTDCDAQKQEGRIYSAVDFNLNILFERFSSQITEEVEYDFDLSNNKVYAKNMKKYGNLVIDEYKSNDVPQEFLSDCIRNLIKIDHNKVLNWTKECDDWVSRVEWLGKSLESFPKISLQSIMEQADNWLLPYIPNVKNISDLKDVDLFPLLSTLLSYEESKVLEAEAPIAYLTPSNKRVPIHYCENQGPTVSVILQEVLGEQSSPMLGGSSVPLRFELLSPARRPIQITSDLQQFWLGSYLDVAKDMRSKYPKHRWPDDPFSEEAGGSMKRRKN